MVTPCRPLPQIHITTVTDSFTNATNQKWGTNGIESVAIATDTHWQDHRSYGAWNKDTDSDQCSLISICFESYINWNPTTIFNATRSRYFTVFLAACKFKMRFISFIIAGAFFNIHVYAYAKPVRLDDSGIGHLVPWCDGYNDDTCYSHCKSQGFKYSNCTPMYVQMPSYKFALTLTCKLQLLCLRVSYPISY